MVRQLHLDLAAFVLAAALSFGLASNDAVFGISPERTPTTNPHRVEVKKIVTAAGNESSAVFAVATRSGNPHPHDGNAIVMLLDANRNGRYVLFDHDAHVERHEGNKSCVVCHHMSKPFDRCTGCYECHSDMYLAVDIFDHDLHMEKFGGNRHCNECHTDGSLLKTRENTKNCLECHKAMVAIGSRIQPGASGRRSATAEHYAEMFHLVEVGRDVSMISPERTALAGALSGEEPLTQIPAAKGVAPGFNSIAAGYTDAMHGLCIGCHSEVQNRDSKLNENFSRCAQCHRALPDLDDDEWKQHL